MRQVLVALLLSLGVLAVFVFVVVGRSNGGVNRRDYVHGNMAVLHSMPVFPRDIRWQVRSFPTYDASHDNDGPPIRYLTRVYYRVPRGTTAAAVTRFYRSRLEPLGWRGSTEGVFTRNGAVVIVNTVALSHRNVALAVDHHSRG